jgi:hypothetical protein
MQLEEAVFVFSHFIFITKLATKSMFLYRTEVAQKKPWHLIIVMMIQML